MVPPLPATAASAFPWLDRPLVSRVRLRQLALVAALAERHSLRQAAAELAMTQPAATKLLRELESTLGAPLFLRHAWGMEPTDAGRALVHHARAMLSQLGEARDELAALAAGARVSLRVGATTGAVPGMLAPALQRMQAGRTKVKIYVLVNATEVLVDALRQSELDLAICTVSAEAMPDDLDSESLGVEPLSVVARVGHPLSRRRRIRPAALEQFPWLVNTPESPLRRDVEAMLAGAGIRLPPAPIETVSIVATLALLQQSDALTVMPRALALHYRRFHMLTELDVAIASPESRYELVTRSGRELSPAARAFVATLREAHPEA